MITVRQHEKLIDRITGLSELEFTALIDDLAEYVNKNNLHHVINGSFIVHKNGLSFEDLEEELETIEREKSDLEDKLSDIRRLIDEAEDIEEYEDQAFDKLKSVIDKIKDEL